MGNSKPKLSGISQAIVSTILSNVPDIVFVKDKDGVYIECNDACATLVGKSRDEIIGSTDYDLFPEHMADFFRQRDLAVLEQGKPKRNEEWVSYPDGRKVLFDTIKIPYDYQQTGEAGVLGVSRDITEQKISQEIIALRCRLSEMVFEDDKNLILQEALDTAERLTFSQIGFFHFFEEDEDAISLQVWSTNTMENVCKAEADTFHYPISKAGVWVDCVHQKQVVIHEDYASLPHKKGMPKGHPNVIRELTVPLFRKGKVVAVIGVGNKESEYTESDVKITEQIADLCFDYSERIQVEKDIKFMAYNDLLTRLPNRQLFSDRLNQALVHSKRSDKIIAICYLDLDEFKPINDQHGHDIGDRLLIELSRRLSAELREGDTLARIGGDEFALILDDLNDISEAEEIVQRILSSCCSPFDIMGHRLIVSSSIGITCYPDDSGDADTLLRNADQAMYQAKRKGRNTFQLYKPIQNKAQKKREQFLAEFNTAIKTNQLVLHYQPRIDLQSNELAGVEALVRWQHPSKGLLNPNHFLPKIQRTKLEIALDEWVLVAALDQHLAWKQQGLTVPVSVNVTPSHVQQSSFPLELSKILSRYPEGISHYLELEVLEMAAVSDIAKVSDIMKRCTSLGVAFSLDDFGTGYSSLTYFHRLPIDTLKIDKSFVINMLDSRDDKEIVEGVISLARSLDRPVVAEGAESKELCSMLRQLGCQFAQGFGISRPIPAEELYGWLQQWRRDNISNS